MVCAIGQELQCLEGIGGAASAQVELHCKVLPLSAGVADCDEIDGTAPDHSLGRKPAADLLCLLRNAEGVGGIGGKTASKVGLFGRTAEKLVVGGDDLDLSQRIDPELDARATHLLAPDALLDHPSSLGEFVHILVEGVPIEVGSDSLPHGGMLRPVAPRRQAREVDQNVSEAAHALVGFYEDLLHRGMFGTYPHYACDDLVQVRKVLVPERMRNLLLREELPTSALAS